MKNSAKILGLTALTLLPFSSAYLTAQEIQLSQSQQVQETRIEEDCQLQENYQLIKQDIRYFLKDYINQLLSKKVPTYKRLKEEYGLEELVERYALNHDTCLNQALLEIKEGKKQQEDINPEQEYTSLYDIAIIMGKSQKILVGGKVNYEDENVIKAQTAWNKVRKDHFKKLLLSKGETFQELLINAYTKQEFENYVSEQNKVIDLVFNEMKKTLGFFSRKLGGDAEIATIDSCSQEAYLNELNKFSGR